MDLRKLDPKKLIADPSKLINAMEETVTLLEQYPMLRLPCEHFLKVFSTEFAKYYFRKLFNERWFDLARRPQGCQREFNQLLREFGGHLKTLYGVKKHRPTTNGIRDRKIWELRNQGLKLAQIGREFKLKPSAVAQAVKREERRRQRKHAEAGAVLELLANIARELKRGAIQNPEAKPIPEGPVN